MTKDISNSHDIFLFFNNAKNVWHTIFSSSDAKQDYFGNTFIENFMKKFIEKEVKASLKPTPVGKKGPRF